MFAKNQTYLSDIEKHKYCQTFQGGDLGLKICPYF